MTPTQTQRDRGSHCRLHPRVHAWLRGRHLIPDCRRSVRPQGLLGSSMPVARRWCARQLTARRHRPVAEMR